jgi:circadian clock protein KaiC
MSAAGTVPIAGLPTGVPGLDAIVGGDGLPEYSFNLIAGPPGSGKTTLVQQIMFANATAERPAIFFTVLGEPTLKMIRYMQQLTFFDRDKVGNAVRFVNLSDEALSHDLDNVLGRIRDEVQQVEPSIVIVDSFRTMLRTGPGFHGDQLDNFVQRLAQFLTSWKATTFLVGEYTESELEHNPVFTVADSVMWLWQSAERNSVVRKLQLAKMRGRAPTPGLHTFRITNQGLRVFPRRSIPAGHLARPRPPGEPRLSLGNAGLDGMTGGGIVPSSSVLVAGPAGSGKTLLATQFAAGGLDNSEAVVIAIFEETPEEYLARAASFGFELAPHIEAGKLRFIHSRALDLSVDETLYEIERAVDELNASRVIIDSLTGFEVAVAPTFQPEYRESIYRLVGQLTRGGITVFMTCEVIESFTDLKFTPHAISFLTDVIIVQRYVEMSGRLRKMMSVIKMRNSEHTTDLRLYDFGRHGIEVGDQLSGYRGVVTGVPAPTELDKATHPGLNLQEMVALQAIVALGPATVDAIAARLDLDRKDIEAGLARLVALHYAEAQPGSDGETVYRIGKLA